MEIKALIEAVKAKKNGTMQRISYKSELPLKANFKKHGIKITKFVEATVRFGVGYENISTVIDRKADESYVPAERHYDREWVVDNKVYTNNNNGKTYVRFANVNGGGDNRKVYFVVEDSNGKNTVNSLTDTVKEYVINSYWNKKAELPEIQDVNADNIIEVM